jgi:hypothetical protein
MADTSTSEAIALSAETAAWLAARKSALGQAATNVGSRNGAAEVVAYATVAALPIFGPDPELAGYPLSNETTKTLLDLYRDREKPTDGRRGVALSRQIAVLESFRKQLIGRRSPRSLIWEHQAAYEVGRSTAEKLIPVYLVGGSIE